MKKLQSVAAATQLSWPLQTWPTAAWQQFHGQSAQAGALGERGVTAAKCFVCKCEARDREMERESSRRRLNYRGNGEGEAEAQLLVRSSELLAQLSIMAAHWL